VLEFFQTARLLGLGPEKIVLLDTKTKILAKAQNTADLLQVTYLFPRKLRERFR